MSINTYKTHAVCNDCHLFFFASINCKEEDINDELRKIKCPICGKEELVIVPSDMRVIIRSLIIKGYNVRYLFNTEIGVEMDPVPEENLLEQLPEDYAFTKSKSTVIIYNKKIFDSKKLWTPDAQYRTNNIINFLGWVRKLLLLTPGRELTKEDLEHWGDNNDEE